MIPLSELEKLRIGCECDNLKQVSATEFLALFAHLSESKKDSERLDKLEAYDITTYLRNCGALPLMKPFKNFRSAIDSLKKD